MRIFIALFCILGAAGWLEASHFLKTKIESTVAETCPKCRLHIDRLILNPFTGTAAVHGISFAGDPGGTTIVWASADEVIVHGDVADAVARRWKIRRLVVNGLAVRVEEIHNPHPPKPNPKDLTILESSYTGKPFESLPPVTVEAVEIRNSRFGYRLKIFGLEAPIDISDINADVTALATRAVLAPRFAMTHLTGRVENSGALNLHCKLDLFSEKNRDQVEIELAHQKMDEFNPFFMTEDGIHVSGEIDQAHALMYLEQGRLSGELSARYHELRLKMHATPDTGSLKAAIMTIIEGLKVVETKPDPSKAPVSYRRKPDQSPINFMLQGLKAAALKVISK